jgi:hypothetical protein
VRTWRIGLIDVGGLRRVIPAGQSHDEHRGVAARRQQRRQRAPARRPSDDFHSRRGCRGGGRRPLEDGVALPIRLS